MAVHQVKHWLFSCDVCAAKRTHALSYTESKRIIENCEPRESTLPENWKHRTIRKNVYWKGKYLFTDVRFYHICPNCSIDSLLEKLDEK